MARVVLDRLSKTHDNGFRAVRDVILEIGDEELVVLVGPSGCGKSTTLRMIAGLETMTSGTITIGDVDVSRLPARERNIAMVFQSYALYPHMTVAENMAFPLKLRKLPRATIEQKVRAAAAMLDLRAVLDRTPRQLSGGQRQRVALGRAVVRDPQCFLFDEPLSNLDARLRTEMRVEIKRLQRQLRATTIYVTHDQEEAMTLADRLVVMKDGVVQQVGTPLDVYRQPGNRFIAAFLGSPAMNLIRARVHVADGAPCLRVGPAALPLPSGEALARAGSGEVIVGIRPHAFSDRPGDAAGGLATTVSLVEHVGDRMHVHATMADQQTVVAALTSRSDVRVGDPLTLHVDPARMHLFTADEQGRALS